MESVRVGEVGRPASAAVRSGLAGGGSVVRPLTVRVPTRHGASHKRPLISVADVMDVAGHLVLRLLSQHPVAPHLPLLRAGARSSSSPATAGREERNVMDKLLLTPTEAADALGIGRSKVYELLRAGTLAWIRIDRCRRIPLEDLTAMISRLRGSGDGRQG